jgi:hypothetical protein
MAIPISTLCIPASTTTRFSFAPSMCWRWMATIYASSRSRCARPNLAGLLALRPAGIFVSDLEQGEIGPDLFRKVCEFGFEGLASKRRDRSYRAGRSKRWIKVKNRKHPAMSRVMKAFA